MPRTFSIQNTAPRTYGEGRPFPPPTSAELTATKGPSVRSTAYEILSGLNALVNRLTALEAVIGPSIAKDTPPQGEPVSKLPLSDTLGAANVTLNHCHEILSRIENNL